MPAHRRSYELTYGPIPSGKMILHECDNPACCRPDHLFIGDQDENMADMVRKGRQAHGERHFTHTKPDRVARGERAAKARLTEEQVCTIRERYSSGNASSVLLGREYDVWPSSIIRIIKRQTWKHVP
jgi:hypothetical protein